LKLEKLYFVNRLDFVCSWTFQFLKFGTTVWLDLDCILKILTWILIVKYHSPLISGKYQCWTCTGLRIVIQTDFAIPNRIRIELDLKNSTGSDLCIQSEGDFCIQQFKLLAVFFQMIFTLPITYFPLFLICSDLK